MSSMINMKDNVLKDPKGYFVDLSSIPKSLKVESLDPKAKKSVP